jgi:hypothetical protein
MPGHGNRTSVTLGAEGGADVLKVNGESEGDIDLVERLAPARGRRLALEYEA